MPEIILTPRSAADGLPTVNFGSLKLCEAPALKLSSVMPFQGQVRALDAALRTAHGLAVPHPNRMTHSDTAQCLWTGRGQVFLVQPEPAPDLAGFAALTDQTDAWVTLDLTGAQSVSVLARLVPIDLSLSAFPPDGCARTLSGHANIILHRIEDGFRIRAFRSMAQSLAHEIADAMAGVAARAALH